MIRNQFRINTVHRDLHIVVGSFAGNAGSDPPAATRTGVGYSVTRQGAGLYRIQLGSPPSVPAGLLPATDKNLTLVGGLATVEDSAATDFIAVIKAQNPGTGVFDIETRIAAVATNLPVTARLHFALFLTDSSVLPQRG